MKAEYIPEPQIAPTEYLIGAHYFPGWREGTHYGWGKIVPFPDRKPLLGWYDEGDPEVADWEIKWALEHGISFFVYCWYRDGTGHPVRLRLGHALHDGLFRARFRDRFRFAIMWENQNAASCADEKDLLDNLLPFWCDAYFSHPGYLRAGGGPLLFVYCLDTLLKSLGGKDAVRQAMDRLREAAARRGFPGLILLCEYRGSDDRRVALIRECGFDCIFAYCWHTASKRPTAEEAIRAQMDFLGRWKDQGILPFLPTATMGWDPMPWKRDDPRTPWLNEEKMTRWRLSPGEFEELCRKVRGFMEALPASSLGRKMLLLDNWNEWGEGHFIAPHAGAGFGYLDAVRNVFCTGPREHGDIRPEDIGLGPYDSLFTGKR